MKNNIPQGWKLLTLGDIVDKVTLKNKDSEIKEVLTNSASQGVINQKDYFDREITTEANIANYKIVENGDYIYNPRISSLAPAGPINQNKLSYTGIVSPLYTVFKIKEKFIELESYLNFFFVSNEWNSYLFKVSNVGARHDRMNISDKDFFDMPILFPVKEEEQLKVISILEKWDEMVSALEEKIEKLEIYKKSLMHKLLAPKGNYKMESLEDISAFRRGSFPQPYGLSKWYDDKDGMPFVQVFDINDNMKLKKDTKRKISDLAKSKSVFVPKGTILVSIQGSIGKVAISQYDSYVDRTVLIIYKVRKDIDLFYFANILNLLFEKEKKKAPGGTIKTITKEVLSKFKVCFPNLEKQKEIANILSKVDGYIDLTKQQLDNYKEQKRTLMKKLLTGEWRV